MKPLTNLPGVIEAFFTERLGRQLRASPHTVASYRDTLRLLLKYASEKTGKPPSTLGFRDIDAALVGRFLDSLELVRKNSARTRNTRLAAIHSLFQFAALESPEHAETIQRVLSIPQKRFDRQPVDYLNRNEIEALLAVPDRSTWIGRRDHALLAVAIESGLRVSELVGLRAQDVHLGRGPSLRCHGKGRKDRCIPISRSTAALVRQWVGELRSDGDSPVFPATSGGPLGRDGVEYALRKYMPRAVARCRTLAAKRVSAHVLRHTAAMALLHAGVDRAVIALWLGHESAETTQIYLHADLEAKRRALSRARSGSPPLQPYRPPDELLRFLESL